MPLSRPTNFTRTDTTPPMPSTTSPKLKPSQSHQPHSPPPADSESNTNAAEPTLGLGACCAAGTLHTGRPTGLTTRLAGLDVYESLPPSGSKSKARALLFISDIFGWTLPNARLLADALALHGDLYVVLPDFFGGDAIPAEMLGAIVPRKPEEVGVVEGAANAARSAAVFGPWLARHREGVVRPLVDGVVKALRADPEVESLGVIGFCWGGRYAMLLAADGLVDAAVVNHPSLLALPKEVEAVTKPVQINIGDKDAMVDAAGIKTMQDVLQSKSDVPSEVNVFPGAVHGFAVRGDLEEPGEKAQQEEATQNAVRWFRTYLQ